MSYNRLAFAAVTVLVLLCQKKHGSPDPVLSNMILFVLGTLIIFGHIILFPGICRTRRILALALDCGFLGWQMHVDPPVIGSFFPVYLWVIFGNGFRFGLYSLAAAIPMAVLSFALVVVTTPYWQRQINLSAGLLISLIVLPAYAGTLIRKLSLAIRGAEEANNAKSMFLASVSHELRTPLTAIVGMSNLLLRASLSGQQEEMVETIRVASFSLQTLIDGVLDLSRIEAGQMPNLPEEIDLLAFLIDVRRILYSQVHAKKLRFDIHLTARTPPVLLANRRHLLEIVLNLAGNAVKFTEKGSVLLAVDGALQEGADAAVRLNIEVSDTGIGISPHDQTRIFEDFTQANATISNRFGGTGLGLAITKRRVELLGGTITVDSAPGEGSTFRLSVLTSAVVNAQEPVLQAGAAIFVAIGDAGVAVAIRENLAALGAAVKVLKPAEASRVLAGKEDGRILIVRDADWHLVKAAVEAAQCPVLLVDETAAQSLPDISIQRRCVAVITNSSSSVLLNRAVNTANCLASNPSAKARKDAAGSAPQEEAAEFPRRVLLVDDNKVNQRVFGRILEAAGHTVLMAETGRQAVELMESEANRLDIVLMDFNMPELDGLEATKLFRLLSRSSGPRLPIIGLTADASAKSDSRWRDAGMNGCLIKPVEPAVLLATIDALGRKTSTAAENTVALLQDHPRFRKPALRALDPLVIENLRRLGDDIFVKEILLDFLVDAAAITEALIAAAYRGDTLMFRDRAHALRSGAINVGATALAELCSPWLGDRGSELKARAADFTTRAREELRRTREAASRLDVDLKAGSLT